jgi:hypothetical protein
MSDVGKDKLTRLFAKQAVGKVVNVKFYRGTNEVISPESLLEEFASSVERSRAANLKAEVWPKCRKKPVNLAAV